MKKTLLLIIILLHSVVKSQTFNGNLGSQSLNWATEQKDFNALPRVGVSPMSLKLWDNYGGTNAPSTYGTLMEIYGKSGHLVSQVYLQSTGEGGRMMYRSAFYNQTAWSDWRKLLDSKSDVESSGSLKITGTANNYIMNGNLGIGTTTPSSLTILDVNGRAAVRSIFYVNDVMGGNGGDLRIGPNTGNNSSTIFTIGGATQTEIMRVNYNGNVGIGTMNPTSKLTVAGNINSREVKVTVHAGADFVFEKNYNLPSLDAVDKYITENKHLPEIASAEEMKKEGINLSEMNIKLLQKIEELTLYMIEMKKDIILLKQENKELKLEGCRN
jgi:hypothetical protein